MPERLRIATLLISGHFFWKKWKFTFADQNRYHFPLPQYASGMPKNEFLKKCSKVLHVLGNDSWWLLLTSGDILRPFGTIWEQLVFWHKNPYTLMARNPPSPEVWNAIKKTSFQGRFISNCEVSIFITSEMPTEGKVHRHCQETSQSLVLFRFLSSFISKRRCIRIDN